MKRNIDVRIEIPLNSKIKYEYDPIENRIVVDRILHSAMRYPFNYGYVEDTLDYDGDPLDVVIISNESLAVGVFVNVRLIGQIDMIDAGEIDTKLVGVISSDPEFQHYTDLQSVPAFTKQKFTDFLENYKNIEKGKNIVQINGWSDTAKAIDTLEICTKFNEKYFEFLQKNGKPALVKKLTKLLDSN